MVSLLQSILSSPGRVPGQASASFQEAAPLPITQPHLRRIPLAITLYNEGLRDLRHNNKTSQRVILFITKGKISRNTQKKLNKTTINLSHSTKDFLGSDILYLERARGVGTMGRARLRLPKESTHLWQLCDLWKLIGLLFFSLLCCSFSILTVREGVKSHRHGYKSCPLCWSFLECS